MKKLESVFFREGLWYPIEPLKIFDEGSQSLNQAMASAPAFRKEDSEKIKWMAWDSWAQPYNGPDENRKKLIRDWEPEPERIYTLDGSLWYEEIKVCMCTKARTIHGVSMMCMHCEGENLPIARLCEPKEEGKHLLVVSQSPTVKRIFKDGDLIKEEIIPEVGKGIFEVTPALPPYKMSIEWDKGAKKEDVIAYMRQEGWSEEQIKRDTEGKFPEEEGTTFQESQEALARAVYRIFRDKKKPFNDRMREVQSHFNITRKS